MLASISLLPIFLRKLSALLEFELVVIVSKLAVTSESFFMITYQPSAMTISENLRVNSIVWIHSLNENEMGPTRRIIEDLGILQVDGGFPIREQPVKNREEFSEIMHELHQEARNGFRPILHIDMHGTKTEGLYFAPSNEVMTWEEVLAAIRPLNVATENNLICIFALCYGLTFYKHINLKDSVPAYYFCAPRDEVTVGPLQREALAFYQSLAKDPNVTSAFNKTLGKLMVSFHCQGVFFQVLRRYISDHCRGREYKERKERMLSELLEKNGIATPSSDQLRVARQQIKSFLQPGQQLIDNYAPKFLVGRPAAFSYEDLDRAMQSGASTKN